MANRWDDHGWDQRVEALEAEAQRLKDKIAVLEDALGVSWLPPLEWRLTAKESQLFGVLLKKEVASKTAIMGALYEPGIDDEPMLKIVDVFVCKVRAKLKGFGVVIETRWGEGYYLTPETKARVRAMMAEVAA